MRDYDVREAVRRHLALQHTNDTDTLIVEEMGVWSGSVRIDVAVINGELCGYELKSDRDTLERLPAQAELYSRVFDRVCLVVGSKHEGKARRIIPRWWSVMTATMGPEGARLRLVREGKSNPKPDPYLVAQLLWKEEALAALERLGLAKGWKSKGAAQIQQRLATSVNFAELSDIVRSALKSRAGWLGKPVSHQREMPVHAVDDPCRSTSRVHRPRSDLLDSPIPPTSGHAPEAWGAD